MNALNKRKLSRKKRSRRRAKIIFSTSIVMLLLGVGILYGVKLLNEFHYRNIPKTLTTIGNRNVQQMLLTPNKYSRPQDPLNKVNSVVVHYTANPNTSAKANRDYFENLRIEKTTSASSHFIIGLEGEIIQCIPLDEISYASNDRNYDTISIEVCHPDATGKFNEKSYEALIELLSWICTEYRLDKDDIIRHYDVSGKNCPLYYVKNPEAWDTLKKDVVKYMKKK